MFKHNIASLSFLIFIFFISHISIFKKDLIGVHIWRQTQTHLNITNFYRVDNNILNPRYNAISPETNSDIVRLEFPLMQWLIAQTYFFFGESVFLTRICMFLFSTLSIISFFLIVNLLYSCAKTSFFSSFFFILSPLFFYYSLNPLPDVFALTLVLFSILFFFHYVKDNSFTYLFISSFFFSLACLVKLPFVTIGGVFFFYIIHYAFSKNIKKSIVISNVFALPFICVISWYLFAMNSLEVNPVLSPFKSFSLSKYFDILRFHVIKTFPLNIFTLPAILFLIIGFKKLFSLNKIKFHFYSILSGLLFVIFYFIVEMIPIDKIHDYYFLPFLPLLYLFVSMGIFHFYKKIRIAIYFMLLISAIQTYVFVGDYWSIEKSYVNPDLFIHKNQLRQAVPNDALCIMMNDISNHIYPYFFDKKGYLFFAEWTPYPEYLDMLIDEKNAKYLYSDNREFESRDYVKKRLDSLILQSGSFNVYKLK